MPQHIGIVACSAEGAALCYRTICLEGADVLGSHNHPEVSLHTYPLAEYLKFIALGDWAGVAELMMSSAEKLARAGADFLICPDNTIHQAFDLVAHRSPRPWLHIAQEVAAEARRCRFKRLGVLGTSSLMEGPIYAETLQQGGARIPHPGPTATRENQPDYFRRAGQCEIPAAVCCLLHRGHSHPGRRRLRRRCARLHRDPTARDAGVFPAADA